MLSHFNYYVNYHVLRMFNNLLLALKKYTYFDVLTNILKHMYLIIIVL